MKKIVAAFQKVDDAFGKFAIGMTVVLTILMLGLSLTEVVRRYVFKLSFPWSEELLRYMLVWMIFMGAAAAYQKGKMINVDLLLSKVPQKTKNTFLFIVDVVSLVFMTFCAVMAFQRVTSPTVVKRISATLNISMAYAYAAPFIGLVLMAFSSLAKLITKISNAVKPARDEKIGEV